MQYVRHVKRKIAYFSMEVGLDQRIRTYSGGLGILAGDTIRSAADLGVPMVAVTLLYRKGYLRQQVDENGWQIEQPDDWKPEDLLKELPNRISLRIEGRYVYVRAWQYDVEGIRGHKVPVFFLDSDLLENSESDRRLTHQLYGGDDYYRLSQEKILGIGGHRMLRNLGFTDIERYHMNEGHAALLTLELMDMAATANNRSRITKEDVEHVRDLCVFTTHTPVPAGHDTFPADLAARVLKRPEIEQMKSIFCADGRLNMTHLAISMSRYINGVAKKHGEISRNMFTDFTIDSITNGVHACTWTSEPFRKLFDRYIPGWRKDNYELRYALNIQRHEIDGAHDETKAILLREIKNNLGITLDHRIFTIGSARRATAYKRGDLLFHDLDRLKEIARKNKGLQVVLSGKAHPRDNGGKEVIQNIVKISKSVSGDLRIVYVPDYDIEEAKTIIPGVDLWLNTPEPPLEASGTSGMKAALNGVPSLSILDGWWLEGHVEDITGWSIGEGVGERPTESDAQSDAASLYDKLDQKILPLYRDSHEKYLHVMRNAIALNGSFFNTQRMLQEYVLKAYYL